MSTNEPGSHDPNQPWRGGQPAGPDQPSGAGQPGPDVPGPDAPAPGEQPEPRREPPQRPTAMPRPVPDPAQPHQPVQPAPYQQGGAPPATGYPAPPGPGGYAGPYPKNGLGVWSLVLGIAAFVICPVIASIAAIVTGHMSRKAVREGQADNGGMGLAGIILGWTSLVLAIVAAIVVVAVVNATVNNPDFQDMIDNPSMWATLDPDGY